MNKVSNTGLSWDSGAADWNLLRLAAVPQAVAQYKEVLSVHVFDAAALEDNTFSQIEVDKLLSGNPVARETEDEANQVLALAESSADLANLVQSGGFAMNRATINRIHLLVARHEALDAGMFRGEGSTNGGGTVNLGGQGTFHATASDNGGAELRQEFEQAVQYLEHADLRSIARVPAPSGVG